MGTAAAQRRSETAANAARGREARAAVPRWRSHASSTDRPSAEAMYGRWSLTTSASGANDDSGASVTKNHAVAKVTWGYRSTTRSAPAIHVTSAKSGSQARTASRLVV